MLRELTIQNYALIEALHFKPGEGLNIITGETGAGKSILLGALGLVLGDRADNSALRDPALKCIVEAIFDLSAAGLQTFFQENDLDYDPQTIVRREILPGGKSRAFVNDVPVVLPVLKQLGENLVDIHSQHESVGIFEKSRQLQMLDAFADHPNTLKEYKLTYKEYKQIQSEIQQIESTKVKSAADYDYHAFLYQELEEANLKSGEFADLETELEWLGNAESSSLAVDECIYILRDDERNARDLMSAAAMRLSKIAAGDAFQQIKERMRILASELDDITLELDQLRNKMVADPLRLSEVQDRIGVLQKLFQKHRVNDSDKLIEIRDELDRSLQAFSATDDQLEALRLEEEIKRKRCEQLADEIRQKRIVTAEILGNRVGEALALLSMPNARFQIEVNPLSELNEFGRDAVSFLFNANKGGHLQPLGKVASGGELSRLMLILKSIMAEKLKLPTLILDEIDTGISGEVALATARMITHVASDMQVIAITHLPQMASRGRFHFHVYKEDSEHQTFTRMKALNDEEKLLEVARMISGNKPGESAIANARELLRG